ncbi:hypothetical protein M409DRAFT_52131 [Zasmidium cellare ATCC 36951]|uniref:Uncharacterized protein n=1 Tax=Zasmidium cellare ATCC 36951 TaxID=1080233 RepID=A0A6A6CR09_ZASCE|nr:uncharacterized protein M409DRAFT_52131 [Zasmidium cellare ATCC 36951]KAF2169604.1 hypothetical protein M409DRAFT_52131 [Zasmidium cellare ATCC 36951]
MDSKTSSSAKQPRRNPGVRVTECAVLLHTHDPNTQDALQKHSDYCGAYRDEVDAVNYLKRLITQDPCLAKPHGQIIDLTSELKPRKSYASINDFLEDKESLDAIFSGGNYSSCWLSLFTSSMIVRSEWRLAPNIKVSLNKACQTFHIEEKSLYINHKTTKSRRPQHRIMDEFEPTIRLVSSLPLSNLPHYHFWAVVVKTVSPDNALDSHTWLSAIFLLRIDAIEHLSKLIKTTSPVGYRSGVDYLALNALGEIYSPAGEYLGDGYELITVDGWTRMSWMQVVPWELVLPPWLTNWDEGVAVNQQNQENAASNTQPTAPTAPVTTTLRPLQPSTSNSQPTNAGNVDSSGGAPETTPSRKPGRVVPKSDEKPRPGSGKKKKNKGRLPSNF